ncbi:MAG: hypothetical protein QOG34_1367 [Frankiaceae bacterium]|nr:hypothetical protein [Frankiaceae bacterium]
MVGVTTDASGRLTAVVAVCRHSIDGLVVNAGSGDRKRVLQLKHERAFPEDFTVILNDPGDGWTRTPDAGQLTADASYTISGWGDNNNGTLFTLRLAPSDIAGLSAGQVLYPTDISGTATAVASTTDFHAKACAEISPR